MMRTLLVAMVLLAGSLHAADGWVFAEPAQHLGGQKLDEADLEFRPVLVVRVRDNCKPSDKALKLVGDIFRQQRKSGLTVVVSEITGARDAAVVKRAARLLGEDVPYYSGLETYYSPTVLTNDLFAASNRVVGALSGCRAHRGIPDPYIVGPAGLVIWRGNGGYVPAQVEAEVAKALKLMTKDGLIGDFQQQAEKYPGFILHKLTRLANSRSFGRVPGELVALRTRLRKDQSCVELARYYDEMFKFTPAQRETHAVRQSLQNKLKAIERKASKPIADEILFLLSRLYH